MQKDALNNVHITDEHVLMTPEQLKAEFPLSVEQEAQIRCTPVRPFRIFIAGRDPRSAGGMWSLLHSRSGSCVWNMLVGLKPLPQRSAIASTW
ncbi:phospho-2-dehydro-3-deoxyheptonate aldolase [Klebsiella pneumoniae]|uniref:Phospho-2-dehydro-3-deoxyheptonate aldolase n=1 Tax=Klebsiella pneumoniae TaxID=573 RepID=A0A2X3FAG2_KLEPN|nr:phospho-2-dehydro-3-deoxyheptonate aldolase [Klebsiella pneumoniae]